MGISHFLCTRGWGISPFKKFPEDWPGGMARLGIDLYIITENCSDDRRDEFHSHFDEAWRPGSSVTTAIFETGLKFICIEIFDNFFYWLI